MKKFLAITAALAGFAAVSSAAPIVCGSDLIAHGVGSGPAIVCPTIGNVGDVITSISLTISSDYTGYLSGNPVVTLNYVIGGPVIFGSVPGQMVTTSFGGAVPNSIPVTITDAGNLGIAPISGITVTPTSSITGGAVVGSSAFVTLDYTSTPSGVPEPATNALLGGGLLAIAFFARRKKA